jgi:hypothetical protein
MSSRNHEKYSESAYDSRMTKKSYPSDEQERFIVRLPEGMRDKIAQAAKANNRSMNAEVVARLDASFMQLGNDPNEALSNASANLENLIAELLAAVNQVADSGNELNNILEKMIIRGEAALRRAVNAIETQDISPLTLADLKRELSGLQYFIEGLSSKP